jgi:hypothetical protein
LEAVGGEAPHPVQHRSTDLRGLTMTRRSWAHSCAVSVSGNRPREPSVPVQSVSFVAIHIVVPHSHRIRWGGSPAGRMQRRHARRGDGSSSAEPHQRPRDNPGVAGRGRSACGTWSPDQVGEVEPLGFLALHERDLGPAGQPLADQATFPASRATSSKARPSPRSSRPRPRPTRPRRPLPLRKRALRLPPGSGSTPRSRGGCGCPTAL